MSTIYLPSIIFTIVIIIISLIIIIITIIIIISSLSSLSSLKLSLLSSLAAFSPITRKFSELTIPVDKDQQWGRRKEELDAEAKGDVGFNRDPIVPAADQGTKSNPILVPSGAHLRTVGYEDPLTHQLVWFNLKAGPIHYIPDLDLYFKLDPIH
jgi:hypothetical protein